MRMFTKREGFIGTVVAAVAVCVLAAAPFAAAGERLDDMEITNAIEDEFVFDQGVDQNDVMVSTTEGVVDLSGTVDNILQKDRAEAIAETVRGVRSVVNRIDVEPPILRSDRDIENDVETALLMDRATESYEIDASVEDNVVTLAGVVDSWQEKNLAEIVVKGVRGVVGLKNEITIDYAADRPDGEIKPEIEKRLKWDTLVDHALIDVSVDDGDVTLVGTVGSAAEKSRAYTDAWVAGVTSVDHSGLDVKWWARDEKLREDKYVVKSDAAIEDAVEDAMLYDPRVYSFKITPDSDGGVVTLRGTVDNLMAKKAAARDARDTVGVIRVKNRIRVQANTPIDSEIEQNIRQALVRDTYVEKFEIDVAVINNTAYLTGSVDSYFEKGRAGDIAARIYGVEEVKNSLVVDGPYDPLVYDPYLDDYYPYDYDWYDYEPPRTYMSDMELEDEIEDEMFWSPYVDSADVDVNVDDGNATLVGAVDTWTERRHATEEAYEGGAIWVYNKLDVE